MWWAMDRQADHLSILARLRRPPWRTVVPACAILLLLGAAYLLWTPGATVTDGRHDLGRNGIWLQHGWLGDDGWFTRYNKTDRISEFRNEDRLDELSKQLHQYHMTDAYPHLAPTTPEGRIAPVNDEQAERLLDQLAGLRIMPWVGGAWGAQAHPDQADWRKAFTASIRELLDKHPRFAGVHINIEPCPSGNRDFILLLEELRAVLKPNHVLSVAAYPPPTRWHPFPDVHWDEAYFKEVASHSDQMVVMMYDTSLRRPKLYRSLMTRWTQQVLEWAGPTQVLLGLPAYDDADTDYHDPDTENLQNALAGAHAGLLQYDPLPGNYQGIAIYSEWEMQADEWAYLRQHYLKNETDGIMP
jgi:hypothetical protein